MRFSTVFIITLCTAVVTALGGAEKRDDTDDEWVKVDPVDYTGTIDALSLECDQSGLIYGCCDGPDLLDSWIVGGCDIFSESNPKCFDYKKIYCCKSIGALGVGIRCGRFFK